MNQIFIHNKARLALAKLHVAQFERDRAELESSEIAKLRDEYQRLWDECTSEVKRELDIISALLHGPAAKCEGTGMPYYGPSANVRDDICLKCGQRMPIFKGFFVYHSINIESEPGFLDRILKSCE